MVGWEKATNSTRATVHEESLGDIKSAIHVLTAAVSPRQNSGQGTNQPRHRLSWPTTTRQPNLATRSHLLTGRPDNKDQPSFLREEEDEFVASAASTDGTSDGPFETAIARLTQVLGYIQRFHIQERRGRIADRERVTDLDVHCTR